MNRLSAANLPRCLAAAVLAVGVSACSGDVSPLRGPLGLGGAPKTAEAPEFVAASRPASQEFLPVGVSAPKRPVRAKSSEGQKALEAELEGARSRNEAKGRAAEGASKAAAKGAPASAAQ